MSDKIFNRLSSSGFPIPVVERDSHEYPLHSRYDPIREGRTLFDASCRRGYVIILGLGFGYHIQPFLQCADVLRILILETDTGTVENLKAMHDMSSLFSDPRVSLSCGSSLEELRHHILASYVPMIHGPISVVQLRSRVDLDRDYFSGCIDAVNSAIVLIKSDVSVQSHFARNWYANGLRNLARAVHCSINPEKRERVLITAAGPSLEKHLQLLRGIDRGTLIIATDTSFPFLKANGIKPNYIVSIDCQQISYQHFMCGIPDETTLVLDLFSSVTVSRIFRNVIFFLNAHPFAELIRAAYRKLPVLDVSGGNVTQTALAFALETGAEDITILGADYSYPGGKSYARNTYIYDIFRRRETRTDPLENQFFSFLFRSNDTVRNKSANGDIYTTGVLDAYRDSLISFIVGKGLKFNWSEIPGDPITISGNHVGGKKHLSLISPGDELRDPHRFLDDYLTELKNLPEPSGHLTVYFKDLTENQRRHAFSILPLSSFFSKRMNEPSGFYPADYFRSALAWSIDYLTYYLSLPGNTIPAYPTNESD